MSDRDPPVPDDPEDALAAEYALGLLEAEEAGAAASRMRRDPGFAAAVRDWQHRLAGLAEELAPVTPPPSVKTRIDQALPGAVAAAPRGSRLRLWLAGAVAAVAIAVAVPLIGPRLTQPAPEQVAALTLPDNAARVEAAVSLRGRSVEVTLASGSLPVTGDIEVWWIAPDSAPVSLGLAPRGGSVRRTLPEGIAVAENVTIALSSEPSGGSPTGQPTGPVIATAPLTSL